MGTKKDRVYYIGKNYKLYPVYVPPDIESRVTESSTDPQKVVAPPQRHIHSRPTTNGNSQPFTDAYSPNQTHSLPLWSHIPRAHAKQSSNTLQIKSSQRQKDTTAKKGAKLQKLAVTRHIFHDTRPTDVLRHNHHVDGHVYSLPRGTITIRPEGAHNVKVPSSFLKYTPTPQLKAHEFGLRGHNSRASRVFGPMFHNPGRYSFYSRAEHQETNSRRHNVRKVPTERSQLSTCGCVLLVFLCIAVAGLICVIPVLILIDTIDSPSDDSYSNTTIAGETG